MGTGHGRDLLLDRYYIELVIYMLHVDLFDAFPEARLAQCIVDAAEFVSIFFELCDQADEKTRKKLIGRFHQCLDMDHGYTPLVSECQIMHSYIARGYEVDIADLSPDGGADFMIGRAGLSVLMESKTIGGDIGRFLTSRQAGDFVSEFKSLVPEHLHILMIDNRPDSWTSLLEDVKDLVLEGKVVNGINLKKIEECEMREWVAVSHSLKCSLSNAATRCIKRDYGYYMEHYFTWSLPRDGGVVICTKKPPDFVGRVVKKLKLSAKNQLASGWDTVFSIRLNELSANDVQHMFVTPSVYSPLPKISDHLFGSASGGHLTGIAFCSRPSLMETQFLTASGCGHAVNKTKVRWFANPSKTGAHETMKELFPS